MRQEFFLPGSPPRTTAQMKGVTVAGGKPVFYKKQETKEAEAWFAFGLAKHRPLAPHEGAVMLEVEWRFPRGRHKDGTWKVTRPDTDNLQKMLKDVMTACGYWKDDAQVVCEIVRKKWAEKPGVFIMVDDLEG